MTVAERVEALLERIDRSQETVNAYITVCDELARRDAAACDERRARGERLGPLDGWTVAVKDNIDVAGVRATRGSAFFADRVATADAEVVRRLRAAGAVIVGKLALHEFAYGATTDNPHFGPCRNPWDLDRVPGGSSGGSGAALAAELCDAALGSDTGGSVRIPAALCGVSALRPTSGPVSTRGTFPVSATLDTIGPMARSVTGVAGLLAVIAGFDRDDPNAVEHPYADPNARLAEGVAGLRVGVPGGFFADDLAPEVAAHTRAAADALAGLGADVAEIAVEGAREATAAATLLIRAEATALHAERLQHEPGRFGADVRRRLELGVPITGTEVAGALEHLREWRMRMRHVFDRVDVLLTPTTATSAPLRANADMIAVTAQLTRFTYPWSFAGLPAASVPAGLDAAGLPLGVQLAGAPWDDATVLRCAFALEQTDGRGELRPPDALRRPSAS